MGCPAVVGGREPRILVWPRIPKTAGSTVLAVLDRLAGRNNFTLDKPYGALTKMGLPASYGNETIAREALHAAFKRPGRTILADHFGYPSLLHPDIAYVSVVRDPIDRCYSEFNYLRSPDRDPALRAQQLLWFNGTAEECIRYYYDAVAKGRKLPFSCCGKANAQARYLAGPLDDPRLVAANDKDLALRALNSVDKEFKVVGTMEKLEATMALLERTYPTYFRGAVELLRSVKPEKVTAYERPGPAVKTEFARYFAADNEVFSFVEKRFAGQLAACGMKPNRGSRQ